MQRKTARRRLLLADDLPEIRERVAKLLRSHFDVVAIAQNGQQAIEAASTFNPDLVVLDISMPILSGIQVVSRLRDLGCKAKIIFLTIHEDADYIEAAFSVGASGYVFKSRVATDLIHAVHTVLQGHEFTSVKRRSTLQESAGFAHVKTHPASKRA
jgi:DNA-binding NarL/FixJ family response regulator